MALIEFLKTTELFKQLDSSELSKIEKVLKIITLPPNSLIYEVNSERDSVYIVQSGSVELYRHNYSGSKEVINILKSRESFGEGTILDSYPHSSNAITLQDTSLISFTRKEIVNLMENEPLLASKILAQTVKLISRRIRLASFNNAGPGSQYASGRTRTEHDLLGDRDVPFDAYYGIQTLRALENFNISGVPISHYPNLIKSLAIVKMAAAKANNEVGELSAEITDAISVACEEIISGKFHTQFVVDLMQGGAGTSTNMNANEVIANRALEIMGHKKGDYKYCHPNNHVNHAQSTNDAYPSALKIAFMYSNISLVEELEKLVESFKAKGVEFSHVIKMGRTQLQDAVPMTLGQEFDAYAATLQEEVKRLKQNVRLFRKVNMGGTAIGTGLNANPEYPDKCVKHLADITGFPIELAANLVESTQDTGAFVLYSSTIKRLAVKLSKICNDLRLLSSGPRAGLGEINLPKMQPGSSIMPGKVNPVIPEVVNQIAFNVIGHDLTITLAAEAGQLELNVMEPVIAMSLFESIEQLSNGMRTLRTKCIDGITANEEVCKKMVENSIGIITALNPVLGYEVCSQLAKEALETNAGVYDLIIGKNLLTREQLDKFLSPENMINNIKR
jgi:aspartate ammonia-lyase